MTYLFREPERDPELGNALRRLESEEPTERADALRQRIVGAALPGLARLRSPAPSWWQWLSAWNRVTLPLGAAAALVAGVLIYDSGDSAVLTPSTEVSSDSSLVLSALAGPESSDQPAPVVIVPEGNEWLFEQAATQ